MLDLIMRYVVVASALLVPLLLLAGFVWVIMRPISLEDVQKRRAGGPRSRDDARDPGVPRVRPAEAPPAPSPASTMSQDPARGKPGSAVGPR